MSPLLTNFTVSPTQMTFVSFVLAVMASLSFYKGTYGWILLGGLLAQLSSIVDGCDGEIARLKYQHSFFGLWLLLLLVIILLFIIYKVLMIFGYLPTGEEKEKEIEKKVMQKLRSKEKKAKKVLKKR